MENYEKKYKEALERASKLRVQKKFNIVSQMMEHIFPELKENEDNRIRKDILEHIQFCTESIPDRDKYIAWLEKQGQTFTKKDVDDAYLKGVCDAKSELEKQDKSKFEQCIQEGDKIVTNEDGTRFNVSQLERVAKKEPKFHEGEWVVHNATGIVHQIKSSIENVTNKTYSYDLIDGGYISSDEEVNYHLWTIQDAEDGDVLISKYGKPFIYNCNLDSFDMGSYCGISTEDRFNVATKRCNWTENVNIQPATKKQRDLLFQKMHEAGYEWDANNKELKKIEPRFKVGYEIKKFGEEPRIITKIDEKGYWSEDLFICGFDEECICDLVKPKPLIEMITPEESLGILN